MDLIPKKLLSNYIIHNETMKFATFHDEEFEKNITDENINEQILISNIDKLNTSMNTFINKFSNLIKENDINEYIMKLDMKPLKFLIVSKQLLMMYRELKIKLGEKKENEIIEINEEYCFDNIIKEYKNDEYKIIFEKNFPYGSNDYDELKKTIEINFSYIDKIKNSKEKIGLIHLNLMVRYLNIYTYKIINEIDIYVNLEEKKSKSKENQLLSALVLIKRVLTYPFSLLNSFLLSSEDICNIPEKSKEWDNIKKMTFRVNSKEDDKIAQILKNGDESQSYIYSVFYDSISQKNTASKVFTALGQGIRLKLDKELKDIHFKKAQLAFKPQLLIDILKLKKNKMVKKITAQTYPSIAFRRKLYLKREYKEINLDYINELLNFLNGKTNAKSEKNSIENLIELSEENKSKPLYYEKIEKKEKKYYVSTTLFYDSEIIFKKNMEEKKSLLKSLNPFSKTKIFNNDTLLIHIHGGAYISGSTFTQEDYLREWSKKMDIPFLGINYGLSPEHIYPEQTNECFQAYMWILKHAKNELNMDIKNIILSGDSCGAIITLSLVFILITINQYENVNIKLPDLLLIEYPTTYCGEDNVTNSLILSIKDMVFDPFFSKYVRDCYVSHYKNMNDPFLNPIKANEKILKYLPRTRIFFGSTDPLRDDSIRILYPISKVQGLDVRGYEFYNYWHAFNGITPKELRKMPWDFVFTEVEEFLNSKKEQKTQ